LEEEITLFLDRKIDKVQIIAQTDKTFLKKSTILGNAEIDVFNFPDRQSRSSFWINFMDCAVQLDITLIPITKLIGTYATSPDDKSALILLCDYLAGRNVPHDFFSKNMDLTKEINIIQQKLREIAPDLYGRSKTKAGNTVRGEPEKTARKFPQFDVKNNDT